MIKGNAIKKNSEVYGNNDNSKHRDRFKKSLNKVKIHQSMHIENVLKQPYFRTWVRNRFEKSLKKKTNGILWKFNVRGLSDVLHS